MIKEIIYKLFRLEEFPCHSCETLKIQLALKNEENSKLLNTILDMNKPRIEPIAEQKPPIPIMPKNITWNVRRQMIEAEDRRAAQIIQEQARIREEELLKDPKVQKDIEDLERELGVEHAN